MSENFFIIALNSQYIMEITRYYYTPLLKKPRLSRALFGSYDGRARAEMQTGKYSGCRIPIGFLSGKDSSTALPR